MIGDNLMEKSIEERWFPFTTYPLNDYDHKKIFCFHHAGGSASVYRKWTLEKRNVNFICIELPGKGTRRREPFVSDYMELLPSLCESIAKVSNGKAFCLFGHSMGAAMAFYAANYLQEHYGISPEKIIAAGRQAPQDEDPGEFKSYMGDDSLIQELKKYNATPKEILENKELLQFILPEVRKDYKLNESLIYHGEQVNAPIYINFGSDDIGATHEIMRNWQAVTTQKIHEKNFTGDHFFVLNSNQYPEYLASVI